MSAPVQLFTSGKSLLARRAVFDTYYTLYPDVDPVDMAAASQAVWDEMCRRGGAAWRALRKVEVRRDGVKYRTAAAVQVWLEDQHIYSPWVDHTAVRYALDFSPKAFRRLSAFEREVLAIELALMGDGWRGFVTRAQDLRHYGTGFPGIGTLRSRGANAAGGEVVNPHRTYKYARLDRPTREAYMELRAAGLRRLNLPPDPARDGGTVFLGGA